MGFQAPSQDQLRERRDRAQAEHQQYWSDKGATLGDSFFPGFEKGWHDAIDKLQNGEDIPGSDDELLNWAKQRAQEEGHNDDWEWEHGHKQGAKAAKEEGRQE